MVPVSGAAAMPSFVVNNKPEFLIMLHHIELYHLLTASSIMIKDSPVMSNKINIRLFTARHDVVVII
jgi:hypothetical protein